MERIQDAEQNQNHRPLQLPSPPQQSNVIARKDLDPHETILNRIEQKIEQGNATMIE
jgi:hypothetical protein